MIRRERTLALIGTLAALAACAGILGLRRSGPQVFPHRAHAVAGVSCVTCHAGIADATDDGPLHLPDNAACGPACHSQPHDPRPCLDCHTDRFAAPGAQDARAHLRFEHRRHQEATSGNCMRCHNSVAEGDRRLRPSMAACWSCHEHDRAREVRACDHCHIDLTDERTPPASHLVHDDNFTQEHAILAAASADLCATCHTERSCATCHGVTTPPLRAWAPGSTTAGSSVHRAGFRARHAEEARAAPGTCSSCHAPESCTDCHVAEGVAGSGVGNPHPPGWLGLTPAENQHGRAARTDPAACASCHGGAGEALCVSCHRVGGVGGSPHPPAWSSRLPLGALPCRLCHESSRP